MIDELPTPSLRLAVLCERVLVEKDNAISLIRIINRFTVTRVGHGTPSSMPEERVPITIVSSWTGGLGSHQARAVITGPLETRVELPSQSFHLGSLDQAYNIVSRVDLTVKAEGLYWVSFELDGVTKARVPLRVIYARTELPAPPLRSSD